MNYDVILSNLINKKNILDNELLQIEKHLIDKDSRDLDWFKRAMKAKYTKERQLKQINIQISELKMKKSREEKDWKGKYLELLNAESKETNREIKIMKEKAKIEQAKSFERNFVNVARDILEEDVFEKIKKLVNINIMANLGDSENEND